jgi:hypothetical protein
VFPIILKKKLAGIKRPQSESDRQREISFMKKILLSLCAAALGCAANFHAQADTIYTNQASFLAATQPGYYLETFDSLPLGVVLSPQNFSMNGFSYTASTTSTFYNDGNGWLATDQPDETIFFNFTSNNVTAVGGFFFLSDRTNVLSGTLTVALNDGTMFSTAALSATNFIGFTTSAPVLSLTFTPTTPVRWATVNDFIVGQASPANGVPESGSTILLLGAALCGILSCPRVLGAGPQPNKLGSTD